MYKHDYMSGHYYPSPDYILTHGTLLSCLVDIALPHWLWESMIVLYTQSSKQEPNKRWKNYKQLLCPYNIGARVVYALMSWLGWLAAACTTLVVTVKADVETGAITWDNSSHGMHVILYRLPFMYFYKYIDHVYARVSFYSYMQHIRDESTLC